MITEKPEILKTPKQIVEETPLLRNNEAWKKKKGTAPSTPQAISPLLHVMKGKHDLVVAEIGVYKGWSSLLMLSSWNISKYYAIDTWSSQVYAEKDLDQRSLMNAPWDDIYENVKKRLSPFSQVEILKGTSKKYSESLDDNTLDFCFIDAGHDYESVKEDIHLWFPKVKKGGIIAGDDYHWPGVKRALEEASNELGFVSTLVHIFDVHDCKIKQWYAIVE